MKAQPRTSNTFIDNGTTATTATLATPAGLADGDKLYVAICLIRAVASITWGTPPENWSAVVSPIANNPCHLAVYEKTVTNASLEPASYNFTWTGGGRVAAFILRVDDHNGTHLSTFNSGTSNSSAAANLLTTVPNTTILQIHANDNAGGVTVSNLSNYNSLFNFQSGTGAASAEIAASFAFQDAAGNTGTPAWALTASEQWITVTIAIASATAPAPVDTITHTNTTYSFTRNNVTVSPQGEVVAKHRMRFDKPIVYAPVPRFKRLMAQPGGTFSSYRATGLDHDGVTPLSIWYLASSNTYYFLRGTTIVRSWTTSDMLAGTRASTYTATPGICIHYGVIVIQCERKESGVIKGVGIVVSQDCGLTFQLVENVGGGDMPIIAGDGSSGMERGNRWSLCAAFPVTEGSELTDVMVPWADYIRRDAGGDDSQGGQIGMFRMTRSNTTGQWTIGANREIYQEWITTAGGPGVHAHTAALFPGGLMSHWGDTGRRNRTLVHFFDVDTYTTASIDTQVAYGGFSDTATEDRSAPQPVGAVPGPVFGTHIAAGDESSPNVGLYTWDSINDCLQVKNLADEIYTTVGGSTWDSEAYLVSYYVNNRYLVMPFYSPDGEHWAYYRDCRIWGSRHVISWSLGTVNLAPMPAVSIVRPIRVSPGGRNILSTFTQTSAPGAGVTVASAYWDDETHEFKYTVGDGLLDPQPNGNLPILSSSIVRVFSTTGARSAGGYVLSAAAIDMSQNKAFHVYAFNMAKSVGVVVTLGQSFSLTYQSGSSTGVDTERGFPTSTNQDWVDCSELADPSSRSTVQPARVNMFMGPTSGDTYPGNAMCVAFIGISDYDCISYPIPTNTLVHQQHELLTFNLTQSPTWTWNGIFWYDTKGVVDASFGSARVFCTLYEDANNHIQISVRTVTSVRFAVTVAGVTTNHDVTINNIAWGQIIECMITCDGTTLTLRARMGRQPIGTGAAYGEATQVDEIRPIEARISNHDRSAVQDIGVIGNFYWETVKPVTILSDPLPIRRRGRNSREGRGLTKTLRRRG